MLTTFAGWGPCGALNAAGENEYYFTITALQLVGLLLSSALIWTANSRIIKGRQRTSLYYLLHEFAGFIKLVIICSIGALFIEFIYGDANFGGYDSNIPCDPINSPVLIQAIFVLLLTLYLAYRQFKNIQSNIESI